MSGKKTLSVVVIGVLLAASIIGGVSVLQREGLLPGLTMTGPKSSSGTITTTTSRPASSSQGAGTLVLQIHDPPNLPVGITSVYVTYLDIWIGSTDSNWINLNQTGTINLMTVVNFTQTIANAKVQAGTFDRLMMNISSVVVTWNSANYSASITNDQLTIPIIGDLRVSNMGTSGAVIDISPTIIEHAIYNSTGGQITSFVMVPSANAYVVPSNDLGQSQTQVGDREDFSNQTWLTNKINETNRQVAFSIVSSSLSNSSFVVAVKNTGNRSVIIQSVFIAANISRTQLSGDDGGSLNIGNSVVFAVLPNGTLVPYGSVDGENSMQMMGYNLSAHSQAIFSYWGQIPTRQIISSESGDTTTAVTTTTITTTSRTTSETGIQSDMFVNATPFDLVDGITSYGFKVVSGQSYLVGATSGDATSTLVIIAT